MKHTMLRAKEYLSILPIYVSLDDTVETLVLKMYEFKLSKILVCDKNFNVLGLISKGDIAKKLNKKEGGADFGVVKLFKIKDVFYDVCKKDSKYASVYLESDLKEVIDAMKALGVLYMPVLKSPWSKTLKGFIEFKKVEKLKSFLEFSNGFSS